MIQIDIPMPENCAGCPCYGLNEFECSQCNITGYEFYHNIFDGRAENCPLKEQEARVITREELKQFEGSPCWFESSGTYMGKDGFWVIPAMFRTFFAGMIMSYTSVLNGVGGCGELGLSAYNKTWRCWTAKPTDEQRQAVKWNE